MPGAVRAAASRVCRLQLRTAVFAVRRIRTVPSMLLSGHACVGLRPRRKTLAVQGDVLFQQIRRQAGVRRQHN